MNCTCGHTKIHDPECTALEVGRHQYEDAPIVYSDELKPCSSCEGSDVTPERLTDTEFIVCCNYCGASTRKVGSYEAAYELWNSRPLEDKARQDGYDTGYGIFAAQRDELRREARNEGRMEQAVIEENSKILAGTKGYEQGHDDAIKVVEGRLKNQERGYAHRSEFDKGWNHMIKTTLDMTKELEI